MGLDMYLERMPRKRNLVALNTNVEEVGYWRKANAIHNWFVQNVQDGIDDCTYHREITVNDLNALREVCTTVLDNITLIPARIPCGTAYDEKNGVHQIFTDGFKIKDTEMAEALLPTESGFFFGGTGYDEYYVQTLKNTITIIDDILSTTDFNTQQIFYCSSW